MRLWVSCALLFLLSAGSEAAAPAEPVIPPGTGHIVLLVIDRLGMDDLTRDPGAVQNLRGLGERGGLALMNVRTAAQANSRNGYLTLGAGVRSEAGPWAGFAFHVDERFRSDTAGAVYHSLTGNPVQGEIVHLGIGEARRIALESDRGPIPGALGEALREAGKRVGVFGNGDVQGEERRYAVLIGMDATGLVQAGRVGEGVTLRDPDWPGVERTDYDALASLVLEALVTDDLVVVDLADLARLEELDKFIAPERLAGARQEALRRIDWFAGALIDALERREDGGALLVVSPSPAKAAAEQGVLLAPVIAAVLGPGRSDGPGLLMSLSTKRPGLTMNIDVAPTLTRALGVDSFGMFQGGGIAVTDGTDRPWEWIAREYERIAAVHVQRLSVIQPFFLAQMGIMLIGALLIWAVNRGTVAWSASLERAWRILLLASFTFPLALLVSSPLPPAPLWIVWARIALIVAAIVGLTLLIARDELASVGALAGVTAAALLADIALGEPLMAGSYLGYSPISGSRFYGIGNEYMGILIGSAFILAGALLDKSRRDGGRGNELDEPVDDAEEERKQPVRRRSAAAVFALFLTIIVFLASPRLGINVGGTITAIVGFAYFLFALFGRRFTLTRAILVGLLVAAVIVGVALIDGRLGGGSSHLGQTVQKVGQQGTDPLWNTFERKVSVNLKLIRLTIWSRVVLLSFGVLALFVFYPSRLMNEMQRRYPFMSLSLRGAFVAALTTLVVNDSGIVAAATLLLPATIVTLLLLPPLTSDLAEERRTR